MSNPLHAYATDNADVNLAAGATIFSASNAGSVDRWVTLDIKIGDGSKDLTADSETTLTFQVSNGGVEGSEIAATVPNAQDRFRIQTEPILWVASETLALSCSSSNAGDTDVDCTVAARDAAPLQPTVSGRTIGVESDGHGHADLKEWKGSAPANLADTDKVPSSVQHMATGVITDDATAADYVTEMANAIEAALTGQLTGISDTLASKASQSTLQALSADLLATVVYNGTIGSTGNDATHLHLAGLAWGDDDPVGMLILVKDVSAGIGVSRWITGWANTGDLVELHSALPFTPQAGVDTFSVLPTRRPVTDTDLEDGGRLDNILDELTDQGDTNEGKIDDVQAAVDGLSLGAAPNLLQSTTIDTVTSQTRFTIAAGSADDDAYLNCMAIIVDQATATQKAKVPISAYDGDNLDITLESAPVFTVESGDLIYILAPVTGGGGGSLEGNWRFTTDRGSKDVEITNID